MQAIRVSFPKRVVGYSEVARATPAQIELSNNSS
jgi:hypothetical protein